MISLTNILRGAPSLEEWFELFEAQRSSSPIEASHQTFPKFHFGVTAFGNPRACLPPNDVFSNLPGTPSMAEISMGGINISNKGGLTTLTINSQSTGFTNPTNTMVTVMTSADMLASAGVSATYTTQLNGTNVDSGVNIPPNSN